MLSRTEIVKKSFLKSVSLSSANEILVRDYRNLIDLRRIRIIVSVFILEELKDKIFFASMNMDNWHATLATVLDT